MNQEELINWVDDQLRQVNSLLTSGLCAVVREEMQALLEQKDALKTLQAILRIDKEMKEAEAKAQKNKIEQENLRQFLFADSIVPIMFIDIALDSLELGDFDDSRHKLIFGAIVFLKAHRLEINVDTVKAHLATSGKLGRAGGSEYFEDLRGLDQLNDEPIPRNSPINNRRTT